MPCGISHYRVHNEDFLPGKFPHRPYIYKISSPSQLAGLHNKQSSDRKNHRQLYFLSVDFLFTGYHNSILVSSIEACLKKSADNSKCLALWFLHQTILGLYSEKPGSETQTSAFPSGSLLASYRTKRYYKISNNAKRRYNH